MADRFEDLRTFTTVIASGGINAAAAELGIAKSAVSRRISDLEKRLGATLIERSTRRFEPTTVGSEYAKRAQALLDALDQLDGSVSGSPCASVLVIAAPLALITHVLIPALARIGVEAGAPEVRFVAEEGDDGHAADIAIAEKGGLRRDSRHILSSTPVLCASPDYLRDHGIPRDHRDLDGHASIHVADGRDPDWRLAQTSRRPPRAAVSVPDDDAAAAAAVAGFGLVQLPDYVIAAALSDGRLQRVLEGREPAPTRFSAFYDAEASVDVRRLVDALASALT